MLRVWGVALGYVRSAEGRTVGLRTWIALPLTAVAIASLAGCTGANDTAVETPAPTAAREFVTIPMPDIGPSPAPDPDVEAAVARTQQLMDDTRWSSVLADYPDAVRPTVIRERYFDGDEQLEKRISCLTDAGISMEHATNEDGKLVGVNGRASTEAEAITKFACDLLYLSEPFPFPTEAQRGYIYDYMTQFLVPCFAANGFENPPPPSREEYIRLWPNSGWVAAANGPGAGNEGLTKACPPLE